MNLSALRICKTSPKNVRTERINSPWHRPVLSLLLATDVLGDSVPKQVFRKAVGFYLGTVTMVGNCAPDGAGIKSIELMNINF